MKKAYVYSTLGAAVAFEGIVIAGGAGVQNRRSLETPRGVVTAVSDEQVEVLKRNASFQKFVKDGWLVLDVSRRDADAVAQAGMAQGDGSAQLKSADFTDDDGKLNPEKVTKGRPGKGATAAE